jgi:hypothetical protein
MEEKGYEMLIYEKSCKSISKSIEKVFIEIDETSKDDFECMQKN